MLFSDKELNNLRAEFFASYIAFDDNFPYAVLILDEKGAFDSIDEYIDTFPDIVSLSENCSFRNCRHINEPSCAVKSEVEDGTFSRERYEFYKKYYLEVDSVLKFNSKNKNKYK